MADATRSGGHLARKMPKQRRAIRGRLSSMGRSAGALTIAVLILLLPASARGEEDGDYWLGTVIATYHQVDPPNPSDLTTETITTTDQSIAAELTTPDDEILNWSHGTAQFQWSYVRTFRTLPEYATPDSCMSRYEGAVAGAQPVTLFAQWDHPRYPDKWWIALNKGKNASGLFYFEKETHQGTYCSGERTTGPYGAPYTPRVDAVIAASADARRLVGTVDNVRVDLTLHSRDYDDGHSLSSPRMVSFGLGRKGHKVAYRVGVRSAAKGKTSARIFRCARVSGPCRATRVRPKIKHTSIEQPLSQLGTRFRIHTYRMHLAPGRYRLGARFVGRRGWEDAKLDLKRLLTVPR
jgi:hypothetical protein